MDDKETLKFVNKVEVLRILLKYEMDNIYYKLRLKIEKKNVLIRINNK